MESITRTKRRDRLWFIQKAAYKGVPAVAVFVRAARSRTLATRLRPSAAKAAAVREGAVVMEQNKDRSDKKKKALLLKILIPVLIVIAIVGIYVIKNNEQKAGSNGQTAENTEQTETTSHQPDQSSEQTAADSQPTISTVDEAAFELDATEDFDLEEILSYGLPVIIDFGSDSCIPCKQMAPVLKELNEELRGNAIVKFVDVWKNADAAKGVPIRIIPTQFFFDKDGNPYVPSDAESSAFVMYGTEDSSVHLFTAHEGKMGKEEILAVLEEMGVE